MVGSAVEGVGNGRTPSDFETLNCTNVIVPFQKGSTGGRETSASRYTPVTNARFIAPNTLRGVEGVSAKRNSYERRKAEREEVGLG